MKATVLACVLVLGSQAAHGVPLPRLLTLNGRPTVADTTVLESATDEKPWFCHDTECPKYELLNKTDDYETRRYSSTQWVSTEVQGYFYSQATATGFQRLFKYISGDNQDSIKIPMTSPVAVHVSAGQGPFRKSTFSVAFFVPAEFQSKVPEPTNPDLKVVTVPEGTVFVSSFGGFLVDDWTLARKVKALTTALDKKELSYDVSRGYFTAGYDPPTRVTSRHNEVWVRAV